MNVTRIENNPFVENIYILWNEDSHNAIIIDPGMMQEHERKMIAQFVEEKGLNIQRVLLTHCHVDHAASARWVAKRYGVQVEACEADLPVAQAMLQQAQMFHLKIDAEPLTIDHALKEGDVIALDDEKIYVLETPGHTPGGLTFYIPGLSLAITGDTIFQSSIGRTDLPGGNMQQLLKSINDKIMTLPDDTTLAPGHGQPTSVGNERQYNPYL